MYYYGIKFEFDPEKSNANLQKHGISLEDARGLWLVPGVEAAAKTEDELRFLRIGRIHGKFFTCIFTLRGQCIRLISVRRSRKNEEVIYCERFQNEEES